MKAEDEIVSIKPVDDLRGHSNLERKGMQDENKN